MKRSTRRLIGAVAVLAAVLIGAPPAQAEPVTTVLGTVTDRATGAPVAGACLSLHVHASQPLATTCTDAQGRYVFDGVTIYYNPVRLRVHADAYAELWWPAAATYDNASVLPLNTQSYTRADLALVRSVGSVAGRITYADGSPGFLATVKAVATSGGWTSSAATDGAGRYELANLPAGDYRLAVTATDRGATQWVPQQTSSDGATVVTVGDGTRTTVDEQLLPGTPPPPTDDLRYVSGVVTSRATGEPVASACVTAFRADESEAGRACTGADGRYRIDNLRYGDHRLRVTADGFTTQWWSNAIDFANAEALYPGTTGVITADFALRTGGGTIRGRITDQPGATPPWTLRAWVGSLDGSWTNHVVVSGGEYRIDHVPAGDYRVGFDPSGRSLQYHPGKISAAEAAVVRVRDGAETVVDEQLLPAGALEVTVVDEVTGAPLTAGCVEWDDRRSCDRPSGVHLFTTVWATEDGTNLNIRPDRGHWPKSVPGVAVRPGETTRVTVRVKPAAVVRTTVSAATDPTLHPGVCVSPVNADRLVSRELPVNVDGNPYRHCADVRTGELLIGPLPTGPVQLLAVPETPYGAQWVGTAGGTGDRRTAVVVRAQSGQVVDAPPIRLDRAGNLRGTIQGVNGSWVDGCAAGYPDHPDLRVGLDTLDGCTSHSGTVHDGSFLISGLGPYDWPIRFWGTGFHSDENLATQWYGPAGDRFAATPVALRAGETTVLENVVLRPSARISSFPTGVAPVTGDLVTAYSGVTGDRLATRWIGSGALDGLPAGPVVLEYRSSASGRSCWYVRPGAGRAAGRVPTPSPVTLTAGQTLDSVSMVRGQTCLELPQVRLGRPGGDATINNPGSPRPLLR